MKLTQRLKNLWVLSGIEAPEAKEIAQKAIYKQDKPHKMATIIKRYTPTEEFLKNNKDEI